VPVLVPLRSVAAAVIGWMLIGPVISFAAEPLSLLELERGPLSMAAIHQRFVNTPDHHVRFSASGAASSNVDFERQANERWFIESQRSGADLVEAGLLCGDDKTVDLGWKILDWGFERQGPDGDFPGTGDPFHSTSFFVEAAARAVLLSRQIGDPSARARADKYVPRIVAAAKWMLRPKVLSRGQSNNRPYGHRRWLVAAALGLAGELQDDAALSDAAAASAREGLALAQPDGVNPEKGGFDVSYQAAGVLFAARYYTVCRDSQLGRDVVAMIDRALSWERGKIDTDGAISTEGSTRVGLEVARSGQAKTLDHRSIVLAFEFGARLTGKTEYDETSHLVARKLRWIRD
jgi:hypothetical protein